MYFTPTILTAFADFLHFDEDIIVYDCETTGSTKGVGAGMPHHTAVSDPLIA